MTFGIGFRSYVSISVAGETGLVPFGVYDPRDPPIRAFFIAGLIAERVDFQRDRIILGLVVGGCLLRIIVRKKADQFCIIIKDQPRRRTMGRSRQDTSPFFVMLIGRLVFAVLSA